MPLPVPVTSPLAFLLTAGSAEDRRVAARAALELVEVDWAPRPVPRAFCDLPRADLDDEDVAWDIAARVLGSADPYSADAAAGRKLGDLVNQTVVVHDIRVRALTDVEIAEDPTRSIGAYLMLAISVPPSDEQMVAFSGSPRVIAPLIYAYAKGDLPLRGTIIELGSGKGKRSAPLAFVVEAPF